MEILEITVFLDFIVILKLPPAPQPPGPYSLIVWSRCVQCSEVQSIPVQSNQGYTGLNWDRPDEQKATSE